MNSNSIFILFLLLFFGCTGAEKQQADIPLEEEIQSVLVDKMINSWYPHCLDTVNGGYYSDFSYDWKLDGVQNKFIVTQSRHIWSLSFLYKNFEKNPAYIKWAEHGVSFLKDKMWDTEFGGFYQITNQSGEIGEGELAMGKRAYGNAFAIYGLAQYFDVSGNDEALDMAKSTFLWLDKHARDSINGGYFEVLHRDGSPIFREEMENLKYSNKQQIGLKDYNSSIHLLEAFTTLYEVWPDSLVKSRLQEMFDVVTVNMYDERGALKLYFYPDWEQVPDEEFERTGVATGHMQNHITFGHDVETAFLIHEAAEVLSIDKSEYLLKIKKMVDHALAKGWDSDHGGFFDQGKYVNGQMEIINHHKEWWAQAEALNSFLLMSQLFPDDTLNYQEKFEVQWRYINDYLIDHEFGGWYQNGLDVSKKYKKGKKGSIWKGDYHTTRSLVHCLELLKNPSTHNN